MDEINDRLTAQANNDKYSLAIRAALGLAKRHSIAITLVLMNLRHTVFQ